MNELKSLVGRIAGYLVWPILFVTIPFTKRSRVLVVCGDEILLTQDFVGVGDWCVPGGGRHRQEDPAAAALRELKEETGIVIKDAQLRSLGDLRQTKGPRYKFQAYYAEFSKKPAVKLMTNEISASRWVKVETIDKINTQQHVRLVVDAWQKQR